MTDTQPPIKRIFVGTDGYLRAELEPTTEGAVSTTYHLYVFAPAVKNPRLVNVIPAKEWPLYVRDYGISYIPLKEIDQNRIEEDLRKEFGRAARHEVDGLVWWQATYGGFRLYFFNHHLEEEVIPNSQNLFQYVQKGLSGGPNPSNPASGDPKGPFLGGSEP